MFFTASKINESAKAGRSLRTQALLLWNADDAIIGHDKNFRVMFWNKAAERMYGYTQNEVMGKESHVLLKNIYIKKNRTQVMQELKETGQVQSEAIRHAKDGRGLYIESKTVAIYGKSNEPMGYVSVHRDITKRKMAEQKLQDSENRFRSIFEKTSLAAAVCLPDATIQKVNDAFCNLLGYRRSDAMGHNFYEFSYPVDILKNITHGEAILNGKKNFYSGETRFVNKEGKIIWCNINIAPVKSESGQVSYLIVHIQDISGRKEGEKKLHTYAHKIEAEKAKAQALLFSVGHGVIASDTEGKILFANELIKNFTKSKAGNITGKYISDVIELHGPKGKIPIGGKKNFLLIKNSKNPVSRSYQCFVRRNKKIYVNVTTTPIYLRGKLLGAVSTFRDITKERETEKAKTEFVSLASHQLRTPITEISLSAEMLLSGMAGKIKNEQKKYLENIQSGVKEITSLVETLLNISRIEMGTFSINPRPTSLVPLTEKLVENFRMQIKKKKLRLIKKFDNRIKTVNIDPQIYQLIFDNLFSNAIKYTEKGHIGVNLHAKGSWVVLNVYDTGCGIPEDQQHLVFGKLFRTENSLKSKTKGYGLGLYIIKSIIEKIGGKISFESQEGKGTSFSVKISAKGMKKKRESSLL